MVGANYGGGVGGIQASFYYESIACVALSCQEGGKVAFSFTELVLSEAIIISYKCFWWYLQLICLRQIEAVIEATYCMFSRSLIFQFTFERLGHAPMTKLAGAFRK